MAQASFSQHKTIHHLNLCEPVQFDNTELRHIRYDRIRSSYGYKCSFVKNNAVPGQKRKISCNEEEQWESNKAIAAISEADLISNPISGPVEYLLM